MKLSVNWINEFTPITIPVDELVEKIGAQLGAVDEVIELGKKYAGILIVKVVKCEKHPNADKLSFCLVDDGGVNKKVKRNADGLIEVVCGAPNVKVGMMAAWIPPGSTVPSTYNKEPFVIEAREIRGQISHGMLASPKELAFGDNHEGLLVLEDGKLGDAFAKKYDLDDHVIDIENKMFTHRPDLFGMLGLAREVAGIQHKMFKSPQWYTEHPVLHNDGRKNVLKVEVKNDVPKLVPRFSAIAIKDIKVQQSPVWLQAYLVRAGVRPINNIVDITNYLMLETAQPLHAYDYDKVKTGVLGVRMAKDKEEVIVIGGKKIKLNKDTIVITDGKEAIGLGGVMGGQSTEVSSETRNIIIEVANFDMNVTRRTAMTYGLFTDAATRFTKNQSPHQTMAVLCRAVDKVREVAGGRVASPIVDKKTSLPKPPPVEVSKDLINSRLGLDFSATEIKKLLDNVEFKVEANSNHLKIIPPFWRTDIEIAEDIIEEVGRLHGYDHLPLELPRISASPTIANKKFELNLMIRQALSAAGANEVLTYSFVQGGLLESAGQEAASSFHIKNALSPALQYYRQSLIPSLLEKVHPNVKQGYDSFAIFEIGQGHVKKDEGKLPTQMDMLSLVYTAPAKGNSGAAYYSAKKLLEYFGRELNLNLTYEAFEKELDFVSAKPFDHTRSSLVKANGDTLGILGEFKGSAINAFKLPPRTAGFEIDLSVVERRRTSKRYMPLNRYPETQQDITLRLAADTSYIQAERTLINALIKAADTHGYQYDMQPLSIYQRPEDMAHKQLSWRIALWHSERTLTTEEVNKLFDMLEAEAKAKLKAERV